MSGKTSDKMVAFFRLSRPLNCAIAALGLDEYASSGQMQADVSAAETEMEDI